MCQKFACKKFPMLDLLDIASIIILLGIVSSATLAGIGYYARSVGAVKR